MASTPLVRLVLPALLFVSVLSAWDENVHRAIVRVAQERLGDTAQKRHRYYLGDASSMEDLAYWAETVADERPETESWWSITIPPNATGLDMDRDCPIGDCVTAKIREEEGIVRLAHRGRDQVAEAFRFLILLVPELHQPLNVGYPPGFGLADDYVVYNGKRYLLEDFWAHVLFDGVSVDDLADIVRRRITPAKAREWTKGNQKDWTWETHLTAVRVAYGALPSGDPRVLGQEYVSAARNVAEEQLAKAAVRLAYVLDEVWP